MNSQPINAEGTGRSGSVVRSRIRRWLWGSLLLISILAAVFWWRSSAIQRPHLLIITLDTTRADRLGCYGYKDASTPSLDGIARRGVLFHRAYSPAPLTLPAHASLFTGLYPPEHGLRTNGLGRLDESLLTLPEMLKQAGYDTAAFVSSFVLDKRFGMNQGWSHYDDQIIDDSTPEALQRQRTAGNVTDAALSWLDGHGPRPMCLWVHYYDAHFPYDAHQDEFGDQFVKRPYDGELAAIDAQIARLLDRLEDKGIRQNTWIIVCGDHGEGFGDHVEQTHGYTLYDCTQRVPLLMEWPKHLAQGHEVREAVSFVDLLPTITAQLGLAVPSTSRGVDFTAALQGKPIESSICYAMTDDPFLQNGWAPLRFLVAGDWKYIHTKMPELYDLRSDPGEQQNLVHANPEMAAELEQQLTELEKGFTLRSAREVQLTQRQRRALESLGYLGGNGQSNSTEDLNTPDVKEMLPFDRAAQAGLDLMQAGNLTAAEQTLRAIVTDSPRHLSSKVFLGEVLERQGRLDEALAFYGAALQQKPDHIDALIHLGTARVAQGHYEEALTQFDEALRLDRNSTAARYNLALVLAKLGQIDDARLQLNEVLKLDDKYLNANAALARVLIQKNQSELAMTHLRREIEINPHAWEARLNLAVLLAERDPKSAEGLLQEADRISPGNPQVLFNRGAFLRMNDRPAEAIPLLEQAIALSPVPNPRYEQELSHARAQQVGE